MKNNHQKGSAAIWVIVIVIVIVAIGAYLIFNNQPSANNVQSSTDLNQQSPLPSGSPVGLYNPTNANPSPQATGTVRTQSQSNNVPQVSQACLTNQSAKFANAGQYVKGNVEVTYKTSVTLSAAEKILTDLGYGFTSTLVDSFGRLHSLTATVPSGSEITASCIILNNANVVQTDPNGISHAN